MVRIPVFPAAAFCQASSTLLPVGQRMPIPVTTTRRRSTANSSFDRLPGSLFFQIVPKRNKTFAFHNDENPAFAERLLSVVRCVIIGHLRRWTHLILVTGATGFIGRHLVERLLADDYPMRSLIPEHKLQHLPWKTEPEIVVGSILDEEAL